MNNKIVFITWAKYSSRAESLARVLNANSYYIGQVNRHRNFIYSGFTYIPKLYQNLKILRKNKPKLILITNTNWVIAFANLIYAKIFKSKIVFDSHTSAFHEKSLRYPILFSKKLAKHADLSIVTNEGHHSLLESAGAKAFILSDIPFEEDFSNSRQISLSEKFNVLYVCSYSPDEPLFEVIKSADLCDNVQIYITGDYSKLKLNPQNYTKINFTGYLEKDEYKSYVSNSDAILTLTTSENTMQRAGSEAVSAGKPLVTSNTDMLNSYFERGAIFVENNSEDISAGINKLINNYDNYKTEIIEFQNLRNERFQNKLNKLKEKLEIR